jgi:hypothetical protein
MAMTKEEQAALAALKSGATLNEAVALLPPLTAEQRALMEAESAAVTALVSGKPLTLKLL